MASIMRLRPFIVRNTRRQRFASPMSYATMNIRRSDEAERAIAITAECSVDTSVSRPSGSAPAGAPARAASGASRPDSRIAGATAPSPAAVPRRRSDCAARPASACIRRPPAQRRCPVGVNLFRTGAAPRTPPPPVDTALPLYVQTPGARIGRSGEQLVVSVEGEAERRVALGEASELILAARVAVPGLPPACSRRFFRPSTRTSLKLDCSRWR